jgi:hypothetical protein
MSAMTTRLETTRSAAWWVWVLALVGSLVLHVALVRLNPNFLLGQSPVRDSRKPERVESIRLSPRDTQAFKRQLPGLLDRFASDPKTTGLATPELDTPALGEPDAAAFTPEVQPTQAEVAAAPLPDGLSDVSDPDSDWMPQQEILAITEQRVEEDLEVLPRTFRKQGPSHVNAPDIRLDDDVPTLGGGGSGSELFEPMKAASTGTVSMPGLPDVELPGLGAGGLPDLFGKPEGLGLSTGGTGKSPPGQTEPDVKPVEDLLRLQTRVWQDSRDPGVQYFKIQILRNGIEQLPVMPRDVVYLIDCSASMTEEKLQIALRGVRSSLDSLKENDRFTIAAFRNNLQLLSSEPLPATVLNRAKGRAFLSELHAHGKTDVFLSLEMLQSLTAEAGRPIQALLITDGVPTQGVTDTSEILNRFSSENQGKVSMFALGGGDRVNRLLLDFLSFRNRGRAVITEAKNGLPVAIRKVSDEIARPVLTDLTYRFTRADQMEVYPRRLSHLYVDSPLILVGRVPVDQTVIGFQMVGESAGGKHDLVFNVDLSKATKGDKSLRQEWAWQALLEELSVFATDGSGAARERMRKLIQDYDLQVPAGYMKSLPKE